MFSYMQLFIQIKGLHSKGKSLYKTKKYLAIGAEGLIVFIAAGGPWRPVQMDLVMVTWQSPGTMTVPLKLWYDHVPPPPPSNY